MSIPAKSARILSDYGISYDPFFDKYSDLWQVITSRNAPANPAGCAWSVDNLIPYLIGRGILYYKKTVGDCGSPTSIGGSKLGTGLTIGQAGLGTASAISTLATSATTGLSVGLGAATAGLGLLLAPIMGILQHHSQAVATEQGTVCSVSVASLEAIPALDALVRSGAITAQQGITAMGQLVQQLQNALHPILKGCNAACCYIAILNAHLDFARIYYMDIAPNQPPVTSPGTYAPMKPASVGAAIADKFFPPPGSPVVAPTLGASSYVWILGLLVVVMGAVIFFRK